jgi:MoaA/NifB/PqqE/SkfB family radical SAM enzyme
MRATETFRRSTLSTDEVKRIIDAAAQNGIKVVSFTGGEPLLLLDKLTALISYAGSAGIEYIRTGTNGFVFMRPGNGDFDSRIERIAEKLARTPLRNFWISIDSAFPATHEKMRGFPGVVAGIEKALPVFHRYGIYPSANLGINRNINGTGKEMPTSGSDGNNHDPSYAFYQHYRNAFRRFYHFVIEMGFTMVNCCYPMSAESADGASDLEAVYAATSTDALVKFSRTEKTMLFKAVLDTLPEFRSRVRVFSPRTSLYALCRQYLDHSNKPYPCRGGIDYFFIDSQKGNAYPCGYRGSENLGSYTALGGKPVTHDTPCYRCDWECFRDPSELFGPMLQGISDPLGLIRKFRRDPTYPRLWLDDLRYYAACGFFDGRKPPDFDKLKKFKPSS